MPKEHTFDQEIYEIFLDQLEDESVEIQNCLDSLEKNQEYKDCINKLFRIFHSLKANSGYFHFYELEKLAAKVESVLNALRESVPPLSKNVHDWLKNVFTQYFKWIEELQSGAKELSKIKQNLLNEVHICEAVENDPLSLLKKYKLYYFHDKKQVSDKLISFLERYTREVVLCDDLEQFRELIQEKPGELCIIDTKNKSIQALRILYKYAPRTALIVLLNKTDTTTRKKLMIQGVHHLITYPIRPDELKRELITVTESHFGERKFVIANKEIENFVLGLQAFPNSIRNIQSICNSDEASIKDLIQAVKQDPVIAGIVMQEVKNPLYNLPEIKTIDKAVSLLGKKYLNAIVLKQLHKNFDFSDLEVYKISYKQFSDVATKRYLLMLKWYSKVSISALATLSTAAILGNLGQLLIAKELKKNKKDGVFKIFLEHSPIEYAEQKVIHTTTARVSSNILSFWNLDRDIVDSVRFSDNPQHAPVEVYDLALANHVVFYLIGLDGKINPTIPKKMEQLLVKQGLNVETLQNALNSVIELSQG
ncbi:HDOD domain-containing protein [Sulfurimonas marina]|uniref:HDOD domain-containing protein n=1 Tax=Sulfurimonas marina TaxID=2590551 RepID=A0A7M3V8Y7_9BACT|nr:HDOD domain-containing protein [Sulfurimonas marina]QOP40220.1 HDOD domain-containing protein [Sulfurimonas marina]